MTRLSDDADRVMTDAVERYFAGRAERLRTRRVIELMDQLHAQLDESGTKLLGELEETMNARGSDSLVAAFVAGVRYGRERFVVRLLRVFRGL